MRRQTENESKAVRKEEENVEHVKSKKQLGRGEKKKIK